VTVTVNNKGIQRNRLDNTCIAILERLIQVITMFTGNGNVAAKTGNTNYHLCKLRRLGWNGKFVICDNGELEE